jgi:hypothetical protein
MFYTTNNGGVCTVLEKNDIYSGQTEAVTEKTNEVKI